MSDKKKYHPYKVLLAPIVLILAHLILWHWLDSSNAFAVLTSSGENTPISTLLAALIFVSLRLCLYLIVPGILVANMGGWIFDRYQKS